MSKLARVLTLAAMVAAINLAGVTAAAQAHTSDDPASTRHRALGQMEFHATAAQQQATADATVQRLLAREGASIPDQAPARPRLLLAEERSTILNLPNQAPADATVRRLLAQERYYSTWHYQNPAIQQALAQERAYRTWGYANPSAPAPAEPSRPAGWRTPALATLAAVLALIAGVTVAATRRATRPHRTSQTA